MKVEENKMKAKKIAIFGGSFDPPHFGHVDIVKNLEKTFDGVIVVPSYISPFKSGADDASERFKLCKKVFSSDKTVVSKREIARGGISYSVDTAAYFAKKYSGDKLFFVIGSEELTRLDEWHEIKKLAKLVTFFVVKRPGYDICADKVKSLKKLGVKIKYAKFDGVDISSTAIKIDLAFGKNNTTMPDVVYSAAIKKGLFNPYARYVDGLYRHGLKDKRIEHSYGVAKCGAFLAKRYGVNVNDTVIACILHDIAKEESEKHYKDVDVDGYPEPTVHAPIGAYIAKNEYGVSPEIEYAIRTHSTAADDMSDIGEVVYLADKLEVGRRYEQVGYLRFLASVDKDLALYSTIKTISEWEQTKERSEHCEFTVAALDKYEKLCEGMTAPEMPSRQSAVTEKRQNLPAEKRSSELSECRSKSVRLVPPTQKSVMEVKTPVAPQKIEYKPNASAKDMAKSVAAELSLHKAHDISIIDLAGKTIIADYFVLCSATSSTAVKALFGYVEDRMTKEFGLDPTRRDVDREWVALDYGAIIIHIFTDKTREFYNIERLWSDGSNVEKYGD